MKSRDAIQDGEERPNGLAGARRPRKPYRSPRLVVYGDLRRITSVKGGHAADTSPQHNSKK